MALSCAVSGSPLSSTAVRAAVREGRPLSGMVDDRVAEYITENGLYR